jgi:mono/diheme cytochrome c family protein
VLSVVCALVGAGVIAALFVQLHQQSGATAAAPTAGGGASPSLVMGEQLFQQNCSTCHGVNGDGKGVAAPLLDPRPRDFTSGKYRLVSSGNMVPTRDDVIRSIRHGLAGTSMPSWMQLTDEQVGALADYVMSLSQKGLSEKQRAFFISKKTKPELLDKKVAEWMQENWTPTWPLESGDTTTVKPAIAAGAEPPFTAADLPAARQLFNTACAVCHGADGTGMQKPEWDKTPEGQAITSRNFRHGVFKGGGRGKDLFQRIYSGIPGTPMPAFAGQLPDAEVWRLVHFIQALATPDGETPWVLQGPATQPTASNADPVQVPVVLPVVLSVQEAK